MSHFWLKLRNLLDFFSSTLNRKIQIGPQKKTLMIVFFLKSIFLFPQKKKSNNFLFLRIGFFYLNGLNGFEKNEEKAIEHLRMGVNGGDSNALKYLIQIQIDKRNREVSQHNKLAREEMRNRSIDNQFSNLKIKNASI